MVYPWQVTVLAGLINISRKVDFLLDHNADLFEPYANLSPTSEQAHIGDLGTLGTLTEFSLLLAFSY